MSSVIRGRIDWKPRLKVWRVIWYQGLRDVPFGDYATQEEAAAAMRDRISRGRSPKAPTPRCAAEATQGVTS